MRDRTEDAVFTVSELTRSVKSNLEERYRDIVVVGEISNCKPAFSGHLYFSLKDSGAMLQAVMFRFSSRAVAFVPKDGMKVRASGSLTVYPPRGNYQLLVESLRIAGDGDILADLERLRKRLAAEGLFDSSRKRALPRLPARIGIVTSPNGAALRDILTVLARRRCGADVLVLPASVQGERAASEIAARIRQANRFALADVLILGRGGGSLEDLLAFSDETVVRAVAASDIPVISAVGHETDWALTDFAADLRAPTPSAAAELVSESGAVVDRELRQHARELSLTIRSRLQSALALASRFDPASVEASFMRILSPRARRAAEAGERLAAVIADRLRRTGHRIELAGRSLELAGPEAVLARGYAIVTALPSGTTLRSTEGMEAGNTLRVRLASGSLNAVVEEILE